MNPSNSPFTNPPVCTHFVVEHMPVNDDQFDELKSQFIKWCGRQDVKLRVVQIVPEEFLNFASGGVESEPAQRAWNNCNAMQRNGDTHDGNRDAIRTAGVATGPLAETLERELERQLCGSATHISAADHSCIQGDTPDALTNSPVLGAKTSTEKEKANLIPESEQGEHISRLGPDFLTPPSKRTTEAVDSGNSPEMRVHGPRGLQGAIAENT